MKKKFFLMPADTGKTSPVFPAVWLLVHAGIAALFLLLLFLGHPVRINTGLTDILPPAHSLKSVSAADQKLASVSSRSITLLASHRDFPTAKKAAALLYDRCKAVSGFEEMVLYADSGTVQQISDFLFAWRYNLLDDETVRRLESGGASDIAQESLAAVFGAFNFTNLDMLEADPFMLTDRSMRSFLNSTLLSGTAMSLRDDVLAAEKDGIWYILMRGTLTEEGAAVTNRESAVQKLYRMCAEIEQEMNANAAPGEAVSFVYSGIPFHSYESSSSAQKEISIIATISLLLVVCTFLYIFRNPLPAFVSAGTVLVSCIFACCAVLLLFREIHVLTFVFGTTLIGTGLDYAIHFFVNWKGNAALKDGAQVRAHILRGITVSFISTEICFAVLLIAPFPFLKQVSVFLFTGLLSSFLSVVCLFPYFTIPDSAVRSIKLPFSGQFEKCAAPYAKRKKMLKAAVAVLTVAAAVSLFFNRETVGIKNNIQDLYSMSGRLIQSEMTAATVLDHGSSGWYFLVDGASAEEVLEHEEALLEKLAPEIGNGNMRGCLSVSQFIPSAKKQRRSYKAAAALLPFAGTQFSLLDFPPETEKRFAAAYAAADGKYCSPETGLPPVLESVVSNVWIGNIGGTYYSCILPLHTQNEELFRAIADTTEHVHFVNKVKDIGSELNLLTAEILKLLGGAFCAVMLLLCFFYPVKTVVRIACIPLIVGLVTLSVLAAFGVPLGFFPVTGIILVFGLGLDYIIYAVEGVRSKNRGITNFAIALSFVTTAVSFGALALTSFVPVHIFGLTVFIGLSTAWLCSRMMSAGGEKEKLLEKNSKKERTDDTE